MSAPGLSTTRLATAAAPSVTEATPSTNTVRATSNSASGVSGQYPAATHTPIRTHHQGRRLRTTCSAVPDPDVLLAGKPSCRP